MANFANILQNATLGEIEKPKPLPVGSYVALIKQVEYGETTGEKKTPFARVNMEIVSPLSDVNEADLEEFGSVTGKKFKTDFYLTEDALFRLQDFVLEHVGLDMRGMNLDQALPQIVNNQVGIKIKHEVSKRDNTTIFAVVDATFNPNA